MTWFSFVSVCTFGFGLLIGSFLNVVILRLPAMLFRTASKKRRGHGSAQRPRTLWPRSRCMHCHQGIRWYDNIPLASFLCLRGRCRTCNHKISWQYPAVELLTALSFTALLQRVIPKTAFALSGVHAFEIFGSHEGLLLVGLFFLASCLIAGAFIDCKYLILPDELTVWPLWVGLFWNSMGWGIRGVPLQEAVWGAMVGYVSLWSLFWIYKACTGKEGMGYGDFKLLAAIGAWVGVFEIPWILLLSAVLGVLGGGLWLWWSKQGRQTPIPFGPFLGLGMALSSIFPKPVWESF